MYSFEEEPQSEICLFLVRYSRKEPDRVKQKMIEKLIGAKGQGMNFRQWEDHHYTAWRFETA